MDILWIFIPGILFLGITTSYTDIKYNKIRNQIIIIAALYAIIAYVLTYVLSHFNLIQYNFSFGEVIINLIFAVLVAFLLFVTNIWTAGDGKLLIAFVLLLPLSAYNLGYIRWIPSVVLLVNIFVPAMIYVLITSLMNIRLKELKDISKKLVRNICNPKQLLESALFLFSVYWIIHIALIIADIKSNVFILITLGALVLFVLKSWLKQHLLYVLMVIAIIRLLLDRSIYSTAFLISILRYLIVWQVGVNLVMLFNKETGVFMKKIPIEKLKPGMWVADLDIHNYFEKEFRGVCKNSGFAGDLLTRQGYHLGLESGLSPQQIDVLKNSNFKKATIIQTIPFAPFLFLGVLLTIIARGNFFIFLKIFLGKLGGFL